jgi:hypothetical protein
MFFLYSVGVKGAVSFKAGGALHATKIAGSSGGNMIDLVRRTPTGGLAFSTRLLYSLFQPRSARTVCDHARVNLLPGLHAGPSRGEAVSKGNCFQAHAYEGP